MLQPSRLAPLKVPFHLALTSRQDAYTEGGARHLHAVAIEGLLAVYRTTIWRQWACMGGLSRNILLPSVEYWPRHRLDVERIVELLSRVWESPIQLAGKCWDLRRTQLGIPIVPKADLQKAVANLEIEGVILRALGNPDLRRWGLRSRISNPYYSARFSLRFFKPLTFPTSGREHMLEAPCRISSFGFCMTRKRATPYWW